MGRHPFLLVLFAGISCSPELRVPPGAQISCGSTADCPNDLICDDLSKLCAAAGTVFSPRLNLRAAPTSGEILLQWESPPSDYLAFVIERQIAGVSLYEGIAELPWADPPPQVFLDNGVDLDTQYGYRIRLRSEGATLDAHPDDEIVQWSVPRPPTAVTASSTELNSVTLTWTDPNTSTISYLIRRRRAVDSDFSVVADDLTAPVTEYNDLLVGADTEYSYEVAATNAGGTSLATQTNVWSVAPAPAPLVLTTLSASAISISWVDTSQNEVGFLVEREVGGASFTAVTTTAPNVTSTVDDQGLTSNTTVAYRVRVVHPDGFSPPAEGAERTSANPVLAYTGFGLDGACHMEATGTATLDTAKGATATDTAGTIGDVGRATGVTADLDGVEGDLLNFSLGRFDVTWQVDDSFGGSATLVESVRLVGTSIAGAGVGDIPLSPEQHPQGGLQHWYADSADEPTPNPSGTSCERCGGRRSATAHGGQGASGSVKQASYVLTPDGKLLSWGSGLNGKRGTGELDHDPLDFTYVCPPGPPIPCDGEALDGVVSVVAGQEHACALTEAGEVLCWGNNTKGALGVGTLELRTRPAYVCADDSNSDCSVNRLSGVVALTAGSHHTCALMETSGVKCWGSNNNDALGGGSAGDALFPVDVCVAGTAPDCSTGTRFTGAASIAAGNGHTCALMSNGQVMCWGQGGKLGKGPGGNEPYPVNVCSTTGCGSSLQGAVSLSVGDGHTCAVLDSKEAVCWGSGGQGALGNGDTASVTAPVVVCNGAAGCSLGNGSLADVIMVSAGTIGTCALLANGEARCWGQNNVGQCGDGTNIGRVLPSPVCATGLAGFDCEPLTEIVAINRSSQSQCATLQSGQLVCWGILYAESSQGTTRNPQPLCRSGFASDCTDHVDTAVRSCAALDVEVAP